MADAYWSNVVVAFRMDGGEGSTTFTELKGKTVTRYGDAYITAAQAKFEQSAYFDGDSDYLSLPHSTDLNLTSGDFTIEGWFRCSGLSASARTLLNKDGVGGASYPQYDVSITSGGKLSAFLGNGAGVSPTGTGYTGTTTITLNTWHHFALVKSGTSVYLFLDGNIEASGTAAAMYDGGKSLIIAYQALQPASFYFYGLLDDIRITKGVARYTSTFTPPATSYFSDLGSVFAVLAGLTGLYEDAPTAQQALVGIYGLCLEQALVGRYSDAALINAALVGRYGDAALIRAGLVGRYGDTLQVLAALEGRYHLMHSVLSGLEGRYAICGSVILAALEGRYDLQERNDVISALTGFYSLLPDATMQSITCPVLIGGVAVKWSAVQWTISESSYLIEATVILRDGAEFGSISKNDQVTITWQGTTYTLFVATKLRSRSVSGSPGAVDYGVEYTIVARSLTAGLDEPYALPTTLSWPAATMASAIAAQLVAPLSDIITLDWRLEDWLQPGGTFFLTDETPLAGLRKLAGIVGGILQTSPDNSLIIRKADPVGPRYWSTTLPAWTIEDSGLFSDSESEDISSLYNVITVTNQSATDSSIRFETEEIDRYRHKVKGFRVPWVDFILATSGGAWVTIEDMGIVAEQIVETVEFIDGASSTTKPAYSAVSAVWLRSQLGAITAAEDGSLTSEVTGCSLAEVTYTTRYHAWIGRSDRDEEVQFYAVDLP